MTGAILAIDPGTTESAWLVLSENGKVASFCKEDNLQVLWRLRTMQSSPSTGSPFGLDGETINLVAIERIQSYGMPVGRDVIETCEWVGIFREACHAFVVRLIYRADVKIHLCGTKQAGDSNVRAALIDKVGQPGRKASPGPTYGITGDVWSALGVAVTARETTEQNKEAA